MHSGCHQWIWWVNLSEQEWLGGRWSKELLFEPNKYEEDSMPGSEDHFKRFKIPLEQPKKKWKLLTKDNLTKDSIQGGKKGQEAASR